MSEARQLDSPWMTKDEAAAYAHLPLASIRRAMARGELRYSGGGIPGGPRVVIHRDWLDEWLERRAETNEAP